MNRFTAIFLLLVVLMLHQNCTQYISQPSSDSISGKPHTSFDSDNSGNGGSYDGKLSYKRLVPGFSCGANNGEFASLSIDGLMATLTTNDGENCLQEKQIKTADLELSKFTDKLIAYQEGLYKKVSAISKIKPEDQIFTEAWCRHRGSDGNVDFEFATEWQPKTQTAFISYFDESTKNDPPMRSSRELNNALVSYSSGNLRVSVKYLNKIPGTYDVKGHVTGMVGNRFIDEPMDCRMGGQFDPEAPKFDYSIGFETAAVGRMMTTITPSLKKAAQSFKVSPSLPAGFIFDSETGSIGGTPLVAFARAQFKISAVYDFGEIDRSISLAAGRTISIRLQSINVTYPEIPCSFETVNGCSLSSAIAFANSIKPMPLVIELPSGLWSPAEADGYLVSGDISIVGTGAQNSKIDAAKKSRHFKVNGQSFLKLSNLTLENGEARSGGSIAVESGSLHLDSVVISQSKNVGISYDSSSNAGAIKFIGSDLIIRNSKFFNNSAPLGYGGAIYAMYANSILIRDSDFQNNSALSGGAIYAAAELLDVKQSQFVKNKGEGGAIYVFYSRKTNIEKSQFLENSASYFGGALFVRSSDNLVINDVTMNRNLASSGSALYIFVSPPASSNYILNSILSENAYTYANYFPNIQGSTIQLHSGRLYLRNVLLEKNRQVNNCAKSFHNSSFIEFVSLGQNSSDDSSCPF